MMPVSRKITVSGKVQGVWFRKHTLQKAVELALLGTVQNLPSGEVLIHVTGPAESVQLLEQWCWQGSPLSVVQNVISEQIDPITLSDFRIIH